MTPEEGIAGKFIHTAKDEDGRLLDISFINDDKFNFAFDIVDELGKTRPDKVATLHIAKDGTTERRITFRDMMV